jgi:GrpB-like predicted nucleotidyltransferase (UPF0157 family)
MQPISHRVIKVVDYDPEWPTMFYRLRTKVWPAVRDFAIAFEHVGSTSVPGLAAKPVIDLDVVIRGPNDLPLVMAQLERLGYEPRGNLGIEDREAFSAPLAEPAHNLYVCPLRSIALRNHIALRDHLRAHPPAVAAYSALKKELAERFPYDVDRYVEGKTAFILSILAHCGFSAGRLNSIRRANRRLFTTTV